MSRLSHQRIPQKPATHPDAPVDARCSKPATGALQGFAPCQHVLVNAVHQRAVQVEKECGRVARGFHLMATPAMRRLLLQVNSIELKNGCRSRDKSGTSEWNSCEP